MPPTILVVTGASGVGKTATVQAISARSIPGVSCFHFDAIGVPSPDVMTEEFGGPESWQRDATARWIARLVALDDSTRIAVLDGQTRPSFVEEAVRRTPVGSTAIRHQIVLLDCDPEERDRRLAGPRQQPELRSARMDNWAAYLRGQADALNLPVVDTTKQTVDQVADAVLRCVPT
jgi:hypothetical protein